MPDVLTTIAMIGAALIAGLLIHAARQPEIFRVSRSAAIRARPEKIYPLIADLRTFNGWNPFVKKDPAIKLGYSGPESGKGAVSTFDGNRQSGAGSVSITDSAPPGRIEMAHFAAAD